MLPKTIKINEDLSNEEQPIQILDRKEHGLPTKNILMVKVFWWNHAIKEANWESEAKTKEIFPHFFKVQGLNSYRGNRNKNFFPPSLRLHKI